MANNIGKISAARSVAQIYSFVGEQGMLFYDIVTGNIRISDGATPGGLALALSTSTFNAGDFKFVSNTMSMALTNENMNLLANGTGTVNVVGPLNLFGAAGLTSQSYFSATSQGEIKIVDLLPTSYQASLTVTGSSDGTFVTPQNLGVMIQISGDPGQPSRIYNDGNSNYAGFFGRRFNGSTTAPTQVVNTQEIFRLGATPYTDTGWPSASTARISFLATETQSSTAQGNQIVFSTTAIGSTTVTPIATIDSNGIYPSADNVYYLGSASKRWKGLNLGPGTLYITDQTLNTQVGLSVNNGVLLVNGANQLQVGQLKFIDNTIESTTGSIDIQIGNTTDTANLVLNRNVVLAAGKTFGLVDTVLGTPATMSVTNGVLLINGANQLQVGQLKFNNNTIQSTTPSVNIQIGQTTDTANITLNRNLVLGSSGIAITFFDSTTQTTAGVPLTQKAQANGVATLDATGKIPVGQIPSSLSSAIVYKGGWNASTNTPALSATLPAGVQAGWEYAISTSGTRDIGSGSTSYAQGGFVVYNGTTWDYISPVSGVTTINGSLTGAVTGIVTTADTGTVTNTMLAGSIANAKLTNSSVTIGNTSVSLGATVTTFAGLTSVTSTSFVGALSGNASTVTNGVYTTDTGTVTNTMLAGSIANAKLTNSSVTVTAGTGMSGGGAVSLGGTVTLTNAGVTSATAGTGIAVSGSTGAVTFTNTGVTSAVAGTGITVSASTGAVTFGVAAATTSSLGAVQPDGTTISVSAGVISSITATPTTVTTPAAITVSMSGPGMYVYTPSTNANVTITLGTFTAGRTVRMFITPQAGGQTFNFSGVTTAQNNLNKTTVKCVGPGVNNIIAEIFCTTNAIGGIYIIFINAQ
jgi:hypothetical protein